MLAAFLDHLLRRDRRLRRRRLDFLQLAWQRERHSGLDDFDGVVFRLLERDGADKADTVEPVIGGRRRAGRRQGEHG